MTKFFTAAVAVLTLAALVLLCVTGRVVLAGKAQAAPLVLTAAVATPVAAAPAPVGQSGLLYVVNHGAWG